jgi:signal transduction histidine kinase/CheY-like chemotaxis protein
MHIIKIDQRKITAIVLTIVCLFAGAIIATNFIYLSDIQKLVRNTTTTSVKELTVSRADFLDECISADVDSVMSLANYMSHTSKQSIREALANDFLATHEATVAWIKYTDGTTWCSSNEANIYITENEAELFEPALQGKSGISEMYYNGRNEKRLLLYAPIVKEGLGPNDQTQIDPNDIVGAVYAAYPADELQNAYGTTYSDAGETYVVSSGGTIVLDANRQAEDAVDGNLFLLLEGDGNLTHRIDALKEDIAANKQGSMTLTYNGETQFVFYTPLLAQSGWSLVSILPLSVVEEDGATIVDITTQMVAILALVVVLAGAALSFLMIYKTRRRREKNAYLQNIYRIIGSNIDTSIIIIDRTTRQVEVVFDNIKRLLGITSKKFFTLDETDPNEAYSHVAAIIHSQVPSERHEWEFQVHNSVLNKKQWLRLTSDIVTIDKREKIIFSLTDVSADHAIRQKLIDSAEAADEANRAKSNFLSSMSHDIRTPMNAILGFSTMLDHDAENSTAVREYNRKIATSGKHLLGLINDVLDMSKIESGKTTLAHHPFNLEEEISSVEAIMRPQTDAKNQVFTVSIEGIEHPQLLGDAGRLRQILVNVLSNAMKYTPGGGSITMRVEGSCPSRDSQHVRISVADSGIGMSPEFLTHLFDSFAREESVHDNKIEGTGLGMAITKNLVTLMGGTVTAESTQGKGTTITIELDLTPAQANAATTSKEAPKGKKPTYDALAHKHFLIAEDNELNAEIITAILSIHEATCDIAENGKVAVSKFADAEPGTYDMIFMDVQMPVMNGNDAARAIRALTREDAKTIPIIAMTANAFTEDEVETKAAGMNAHVPKPIDINLLESVVAELS